ncbi:putative cytokinetic ring protein SteA [Actinopolymorpha alba]|uniref:putative cytokinetic ring protein SteA n=1 Tax=Actinopolymorpha alba TaxID=533267 RepID=UPI000475EB15|nr:putative cytokinetic ring protein SteA [Actinopolymorpha alba]
MRLPTLRRSRPVPLPGVAGAARLDTRTKNLTKRLRPGDVAIINHIDLDRVSAESLVAAGVAAVVNAAPSISGRYPNLGPGILVAAGIPLVDNAGMEVFARVGEGDQVRLDGAVLFRGELEVAFGVEQTVESVTKATDDARAGLATQLEAFAANTMEYLRRDRDLLLDGVGVPQIDTDLEGRHVLIVVRGYDYREDLIALRPYIREYRPVLIGVDGGADALLEARYKPDVIVGDMDSVSDPALRSGAELVVHAYRDGRAPGAERLERLGLDAKVFPAAGTSEDVAMLLADSKGAALIVAVGTHTSLVEFLDKGRSGQASTYLTRLRVGGKLVDAKGVSRLYRARIQTWQIVMLLVAGLLALLVALAATPAGQAWLEVIGIRWNDLIYWIRGLFT